MHKRGISAYATCNYCQRQTKIDLPALIEKVGADFCLYNRRQKPCKLKEGCHGYTYFAHDRSTVIVPFRDDATGHRWMLETIGERNTRMTKSTDEP